ncbi:hypothetical protein Golob_011730 [Gossypium lobatum]|uniref:Uncharacterized protein n=1 Tax=Gossypium lobatum TaxID=34289 RepID=A0A7J8MQF3_9ROSI|nr:hypothetical protein [Gossypium lobatum]
MATSSFNKIEKAHQMYREGRYEEALVYYTEALAVARTKPQKIALHSNRAACYLKLHHFKKAAEECTSVLELDHKHTGALMLRAQTLVTLKEYNSALFDVNQLIELNPSSEVYYNLQARLRTQVTLPLFALGEYKINCLFIIISNAIASFGKALAPIPESEAELEEEEEHGEPYAVEEGKEQDDANEDIVRPAVREDQNTQPNEDLVKETMIFPNAKGSAEQEVVATPQGPNEKYSKGHDKIPKPKGHSEQRSVAQRTVVAAPIEQGIKDSKGWQTIPKPKGHSALDYARWDKVEDDSSDDDDDDSEEESQPQYRFRVRTVGVQPVK